MSRREKKVGYCRLCGNLDSLTYEHIPPKAAFNNGKSYYQATFEEIIKLESVGLDFTNYSKFPLHDFTKKQGGVGYFSLCAKCNNNTGSWYGRDFVTWAEQAMYILLKTNGKPTIHYPTYFFPLRVIKQIIAMFFSLRMEGLHKREPELKGFILNRERRFLDKKYKIYCYYNLNGSFRYISDSVVGNLGETSIIYASELSFPPFGFVFTMNSRKPDERLLDITHFANFAYNEWTDYYQKFTVLPTFLPHVPLDYRTKDEIIAAILSSKRKSGVSP